MKEEKVRIPNSIGGEIAAVLEYPDQGSDLLAVLCPGFLDTKDYSHLVALAEDLSRNGYTAIRFDPTGTWESGNSINQYTMSQYLKDIRSVIDYVLQWKTYRSVCVMGHSIGGLVSILYAAEDPRITKMISIMSPYAYVRPNREDERGEASKWAKIGFHHSDRDIPGSDKLKKFDVPYSFVVDSRKYNALVEVAKLHIPALFIAGEKDEHVSPEYMKMIYDKANEPKKLVVIQGTDHDYRHRPEQITEINQEITKFLA